MLVTANIFQPLIDVFQAVLVFVHNNIVSSWGLSIVLLTVFIRALMIPLFVKQMHSMRRLQEHMPELKAIQAKYKDDKQRQQQEIMKFYSENKVNPFASCLPLAAQLPVFISLFYMLRQSLRHDICPKLNPHAHAAVTHACGSVPAAHFLFIHDLTSPGTGATLVVLMLLYVGTQVASSLFMSAPTMDKNQRYMMLAMPLIFVIFVFRFPTGLLLYWITTNLWTIAQGYVIRRRIGPPPVAAASAGGDSGPGSGPGGRNGGAPKSDNGGSGGSGLAGLIRGRAASSGASTAVAQRERPAPPPPPRKKKKRSGRRR
jgi:YidC/Oxa1 family membrane protein insertase